MARRRRAAVWYPLPAHRLVTRSWLTPNRIVLLLALAVLVVAGGLLLAQAALASEGTRGGMRRVAFILAFVAAATALVGAWLLSRELERRLEVEAALRASRAKFEGILAIAADAIITVDESQRILHFNHGAEQLFGYAEREVLGEPLSRLLPARVREVHARHVDDFGRGAEVARRMGERRAIHGLKRDGSEFPAEASISRLDLPGSRLYTVVLRDISERLRAVEHQRFLARAGAVLATSLDYESTLRSVAHLAIPHLADCCLLAVSEGGEERERGGVVRTVVSVHDDPERTRVLRGLERRRIEAVGTPFGIGGVLADGRRLVRRRVADGWTRHEAIDPSLAGDLEALGVQGFVTLPLVARDRVLGALTLVATDAPRAYDEADLAVADELSQRAAFALENARLYQEAQRASQARDEILGVVSHDLRNPISAISMCARVLLESPPAEASERRELAEAIFESTHLMQRLIQDLLDVSTIESGHLKVYPRRESLARIVESAMTMVREGASERGVRLQSALPSDLPPVEVDSQRLEQVLANLLGNAVKFTERGGTVTVEGIAEASCVRVAVRDTGVGIPPEHLPHIFDRYWHARRQSRTVGTGLGLAIARGIVEAHGGMLTVESTPGVGTTFIFTLPVASGTAVAPVSFR